MLFTKPPIAVPRSAKTKTTACATAAHICNVPQTEGNGVDMEGVVFEGQSLCISLAKPPERNRQDETVRMKPSRRSRQDETAKTKPQEHETVKTEPPGVSRQGETTRTKPPGMKPPRRNRHRPIVPTPRHRRGVKSTAREKQQRQTRRVQASGGQQTWSIYSSQ